MYIKGTLKPVKCVQLPAVYITQLLVDTVHIDHSTQGLAAFGK